MLAEGTLLHIILLALIQGVTEFLPVSSSAHLILLRESGDSAMYHMLVAMLHLGTLAALLIYFRKDFIAAFKGLGHFYNGQSTPESRLMVNLFIASLPVLIIGVFMLLVMFPEDPGTGHSLADRLQDPSVIAWCSILFGILLHLMDRLASSDRAMDKLGPGRAFWIGMAQIFALLPGTSRSGITMTMGRAAGMNREDCARFAMLLGLPVILGAGLASMVKILKTGDATLTAGAFLGAILAGLFAYAAIALIMRYLPRIGFLPFAIYRVALGVAILLLI